VDYDPIPSSEVLSRRRDSSEQNGRIEKGQLPGISSIPESVQGKIRHGQTGKGVKSCAPEEIELREKKKNLGGRGGITIITSNLHPVTC